MHRTAAFRLLFAGAIVFAVSASLPAQQNAAGAAQGAASATDPAAKKILGLADIGRWSRISSVTLSANGDWMTYAVTPNEGDDTLHFRQTHGDTRYDIPVGSAPVFSDDSRYAGYFVSPPSATGGRGGRGAIGTPARPGTVVSFNGPPRRFELLDLATGAKYSVPDASTFKFSKGSRFVAVRVNKANVSAKQNGSDLVLRELATGISQNVGNVLQYDFDAGGNLLAYTVDAADRIGNGVYVVELATSQSKVLSSAPLDYEQLSWSAKGDALAVLRGDKKKDSVQRDNTLLVWQDAAADKPALTEYDPSKDMTFAPGQVISELSPLRWTRDGSRIYLGLKAQSVERAGNGEPQANVDVWHWNDPEVQSVQMVRLSQDRRATLPAVFDVASNKLVRIADSVMTNVTSTPNVRWAIGHVDTAYRNTVQWTTDKSDYYRVSTTDGARTPIDKGLTRTMGSSPNGKWFLYLKDKAVYAYDMDAERSTRLAGGDKISFLDAADDYPYETPTYGVAAWTRDGKSVILNHHFDLYSVPLDGGRIVNLTGGVGTAQQIRFRLVRLDTTSDVDLSKPLLLSAYGEWTKKSGYYKMDPGAKPVPLIYDDEQIGQAIKAANADVVLFTRQSFKESPDYWLTTSSFASPTRVTNATPFIGEYAWGTRVLVDFKNSKGQRLQGTLALPANYQPGKKYPMLVYFYETLSNTHHTFPMPVYDDRPHFAEYASDGYLVFEPDIVYETGKPGTSALDCVTSGVKKVIEMGYADPKHIGIQGHSWGGYESSFILTRSHMFAAAVIGAPPVDLTSFYDETYPGTGTLQQGIVEVGQVRMGTNPWDSRALFEDQSAITHVRDITTPFLILQGTADNAVDWHQGLELYGAARRWGKQVILLSYPGEPHHLARKENQKDFQQRMKQFFDHYLKGAPAPKWMTEGVPQTQKGGPIQ